MTDKAEARLTEAFNSMSPLEQWETLTLNGLLGTDEPWIEGVRDNLRAQAALLARLRAENERLRVCLRRYGDRIAMANAPAELQHTIDAALAGESA